MISLRDLAMELGVTYEAVRQQTKRYAGELDGHIQIEGRTQYLDDYAVEYLRDRRQRNPVVVYEADKDVELEQLRIENKELIIRLAEKQEKIEQLQDRIIESVGAQTLLSAAQVELDREREQSAAIRMELAKVTAELQRIQGELARKSVHWWDKLKFRKQKN